MNMETVLICGECLSGSVSQHAYDDEGWGVCNDCGAVEQDSIEISIDYFERIIDFSLSFKEKLKILEEAEQDLTNETEL